MWIDDEVLARCGEDIALNIWKPKERMVVLGRSNKASIELLKSICDQDGIPIVKRLGGGGTVLLHPGCLVVSVGAWVRDYYQNNLYFHLLNQSVIDALNMKLPECSFSQRGFSDIVSGERKLAGTSLFRSRNYLLYQASILVELRVADIERYLAHPSAEPDYRLGRSHREFLMGLEELSALSVDDWEQHFKSHFQAIVTVKLETEALSAQESQLAHIKSRIGETHSLD